MQYYRSLESVHLTNAWLTIGSFDGVHRGHQEIIRSLTAGAHSAGVPAVVLTFYPHPSVVLGKRNSAFYLTTPEQQVEILSQMGVDVVITHPFNLQVAGLSALQFMTLIVEHLGIQQLWVGYDFALGKGREGNIPRLKELGEQLGYSVNIISPVEVDGIIVSSSKIRALLTDGDVEEAARLLGRPFQEIGLVEKGDGRGRMIGVPTANLAVSPEIVLPKAGVYVCQARIRSLSGDGNLAGKLIGAVTNVGTRPTFEKQPVPPRVEAHLLDFVGDLYGSTIELDFLKRLRDEERFPSVDALIEQIHADIASARQALTAL